MALRKAEKEEEKRAREKIRQRLEEDKVNIFTVTFLIYKLIILYCVFGQRDSLSSNYSRVYV